jgi:molecular chaperone Hsp33
MSQLYKFLFEGLPVRGILVQLTDVWQEVLRRRANNLETGPYPAPVCDLLGEMTAAAALMQSNIKFNGSLIVQIMGDGPLKLAVVEVQPNLGLRATAKVIGEIGASTNLSSMVNLHNQGRCAITLDPKDRAPGQQPYQGVVPLFGDKGEALEKFSEVLEHYMLQSEQLDTKLVLAANETMAAGLLIQRLPAAGQDNLAGKSSADEDQIGVNEDYNRIATLAASLTSHELLTLDAQTILHRLFWEEQVLQFEPQDIHFECSCSRERVAQMVRQLGKDEVESILAERNTIDVDCDFCGQNYNFDAIDAAQLFTSTEVQHPPGSIQ